MTDPDRRNDLTQRLMAARSAVAASKRAGGAGSDDFERGKFEDRNEAALVDLVNKKQNGARIAAFGQVPDSSNVIDLMTALKRGIEGKSTRSASNKRAKAASGQREMLLPIDPQGFQQGVLPLAYGR